MTISDETLMAYLDNELPPDERARVDAAVAADPQVKARLDRQARLHAILNAAFDPVIGQRVPERLISAAMTTPASTSVRARDALSRLFSGTGGSKLLPRYALVAATLLVGIGIGWSIASLSRGSSFIVPQGGSLAARGGLEDVLNAQLASDNTTTGPRVGVSFRSKEGGLCRTFETGSATENFAGVACRNANAWAINALARAEPRNGAPYEVAGAGMSSVVRNAVADMIDGAPFDVEQERRARDQGWRLQR